MVFTGWGSTGIVRWWWDSDGSGGRVIVVRVRMVAGETGYRSW